MQMYVLKVSCPSGFQKRVWIEGPEGLYSHLEKLDKESMKKLPLQEQIDSLMEVLTPHGFFLAAH